VDRIGPGALLAGRYRLQERLQADEVTALWRAEDATLERPVGVKVLSADHARVQRTLDAARRAALVDDRRLQRVLGVGLEGGTGYVVLEWITGQDAAALAGKVSEQEAVRVATEAAEALRTAATRSLHHGRIGPRHVVRSSDGTVRVLGTGIDVAAAGQPTPAAAARPEARDVRDLGAVLYALVTGRWPFGSAEGVEAAPTEKGRPVPATHLRGDVSAPLERLLEDTLAGAGPDTLDRLIHQLHSTRTALESDSEPVEAPAGPAQGDDGGGTDDTDVITPVGAAATEGDVSAPSQPRRSGVAGVAGAAAGLPGGAAASGAAASSGAAGPVGGVAPTPVHEDDGWDLLPVDQGWDEQYEGDYRDDGGGTVWQDPQTRYEQPWDQDDRWPGPAQDREAATPVLPAGRGPGRRRPAGAGTGVIVVLLMGAVVVGGLVWALDRFRTAEEVAAPAPEVSETVAPPPSVEPSAPPVEPEPTQDVVELLSPAGVQALDPGGDGEENDQDAPNAIDGDPGTGWSTQRYNSQEFGGLKDGLGLVFDLGEPRDVTQVLLDAPGDGGDIEIRTAPGPGFDGSTVVATGETGSDTVELVPQAPVTTQFVLVWFTALPENDGDWRGVVNEVQVRVQ